MPFVEGEIVRAIPAAISRWILTVLHHAWWGVDLFFVLSGFSLAQGYLRAFQRDRGAAPSAASFFVRRAARIFPAYLAALAIVIAAHPRVVLRAGFAASAAAHLALLQGYVAPGGIVLIGAAWSLTTEAHFYLLLPALARPLLGDLRRGLAIGAAICVASWAARALLHAAVLEPGVHGALLEATQRRWIASRLDQFVLGALAAALHAAILRSPRAPAARRAAPIAMAICAAALVIGFRLEGALYLSPGGSWPYAVVSVATAGLVLSATLVEGRALRVVAPAPLRALGVVSYGAFLLHQLAMGIAGAALARTSIPALASSASWIGLAANGALALAITCALALASWILVERPAIRWAARRTASARARAGSDAALA